jgi:hypothetical protein
MPSPAEIEVEECAAPNGSYSLSARLVKPDSPPQRPYPVAPAGQNLVRIGLVPDVPDQPVDRRVEHVMQRHRQFDHAKPRTQMPAGRGHRVDRLRTQLVRYLTQLLRRQVL